MLMMLQEVPSERVTNQSRVWLNERGFAGNPFRNRQAERENNLPEYFVWTPYFDAIRGNPDEPESSVVFASRGAGKTAHMTMIARDCRPYKSDSSVLAIEYTNFGHLPDRVRRGEAITLADHIHHILRYGVEAFFSTVINDLSFVFPKRYDWLARLHAFYLRHCPTLLEITGISRSLRHQITAPHPLDWHAIDHRARSSPGGLGAVLAQLLQSGMLAETPISHLIIDLLNTPPTDLDQECLSSLDLFRTFVELMVEAGLTSVYVLIDGVDEPGPLADRLDLSAQLITPLLADVRLMTLEHAAFKFFLPIGMSDQLRNQSAIRTDRVNFYDLLWDEPALRQLLSERLYYYSGEKLRDLSEICDPSMQKIDESIVREANGIPRNLLALGEALFNQHFRQPHISVLIQPETWAATLRQVFGDRFKSITYDADSDVFRMGEQEIHLADSLSYLMRYFLEHANRTVTTEELIDNVAGSENNLRQIVTRLRKAIEPDPRHPIYIVTMPGRGYRFINERAPQEA